MTTIEIKRGPDRNGNFKRLYLRVECSLVFVYDEYKAPVHVSLEVTPREFKQWDDLRKAQEARR